MKTHSLRQEDEAARMALMEGEQVSPMVQPGFQLNRSLCRERVAIDGPS